MIASALIGYGVALAAEQAEEPWDVQAAHGPVHEVTLDLREGTWMSVAVRGDTVVFDLLGDLWSVPLAGGEATRLTSGPAWDAQPAFSPDGRQLAFVSDRGGNEQLWVMGANGSDPSALTDEDTARITHPVWDPSGEWVIGRRRTVDTRSIGVTELWQYHVDGGKGIALTRKDEHPHAGEHTLSADGRYLYFSSRHGRFEYLGDPVGGLWRVMRLDRFTGELRPIVHGAGSASRPLLSPDGERLLFVSRDRTRTLLEELDLGSGRRRVLLDSLSPDELEGFALHATYPTMAWTAEGELVLWSGGRLWRLAPDGTRAQIPFHAEGTWQLHDVERPAYEPPDTVRARVIRWPVRSSRGAVAFSALGQLWVRTPDGALTKISEGTGYAPAWSPDGDDLAWTSWSDTEGGRLHITRGEGPDEVLPVRGQLLNPAWSADGTELVVLRGPGGSSSPDLAAEAWYELVHLTKGPKKRDPWVATALTGVDTRFPHAPTLRLHEGRVWFVEDRPGEPRSPQDTVLVSVRADDGTDKRDHLVFSPGIEQLAISPDFTRVAYKQGHQLHVAALPRTPEAVKVGEALPTRQVTRITGAWMAWDADGTAVTWVEGPELKWVEIDGLLAPEDEDEDDEDADALAEDPAIETLSIDLEVPRARPEGTLALTNARVLTMRGDEVLEDTTVIIERDRIVSVGGSVPDGATVLDLQGATVMPGLIDVHAHLHYASGDVLPEQEWRYLTALDYGVTTVQDPSAHTEVVFTQAERVEAGLMQGPRVFSTGFVLYGALSNSGADTPTLDAARAHVRRLKALGARSVKVYQQSQRERRQWYLQACVEEDMLCVPEGGGDLFMNLGMVADGMHAIEHSLPTTPLHADVRGLLAGSATDTSPGFAYTPTLAVAYGGMPALQRFLQHEAPLDDERLFAHGPRRQRDARLWRVKSGARTGDWRFEAVARDTAALASDGVLVTLGAHGELQGLGVHWELWAMAGPGAMTPHDALRAATLGGATYLGMEDVLGSVEVGKLADLVVLSADPLADIRNSTAIDYVIANGAVVPTVPRTGSAPR